MALHHWRSYDSIRRSHSVLVATQSTWSGMVPHRRRERSCSIQDASWFVQNDSFGFQSQGRVCQLEGLAICSLGYDFIYVSCRFLDDQQFLAADCWEAGLFDGENEFVDRGSECCWLRRATHGGKVFGLLSGANVSHCVLIVFVAAGHDNSCGSRPTQVERCELLCHFPDGVGSLYPKLSRPLVA